MATDDLDQDPRLAQRLAALHPDVADDGFTASLMARLPAQAPAKQPARAARPPAAWPIAVAAAFALTVLALLAGSGGEAPVDAGLAARLDAASTTARAAGDLLGELPALFETHLYTLVAAALCAATLLAPQLLED